LFNPRLAQGKRLVAYQAGPSSRERVEDRVEVGLKLRIEIARSRFASFGNDIIC
jgi:hypothetical protein